MVLPGLIFVPEHRLIDVPKETGLIQPPVQQPAAKFSIQRKLVEVIRSTQAIDTYLPAELMIAASYLEQEDPATGASWVLPKYIIRWMVSQDMRFLQRANIDPEEKCVSLAVWERKFGSSNPV